MKEAEDKNKKLERTLKENKERIADVEREVTLLMSAAIIL